MGTFTWTGGAHSFDWNDTDNWDAGSVPTSDDDVVIPGAPGYNAPTPSADARVKNLTIRGGGLQARMAATESFDWQGGEIRDGVALAGASLSVSGAAEKTCGGKLELTAGGTVTQATVGLHTGARLISHGSLTASGNSRLHWVSGANSFIVSDGNLNVIGGSFAIDDVIGILRNTVSIAPGSSLVVSSRTVPTYLFPKARVTGGGTLRVRDGRLYADATALIDTGTTMELETGGNIEPAGTRTFYKTIVGAVPGTQGLTVAGQLHWTGGLILGNVLLTRNGVLRIDGPETHEHRSGQLRLQGSGAMTGPTDLRVDTGGWRIDGDLLLEGPLFIDRGRDWNLTVPGTLRIAGATGEVRFGNFPITIGGACQVESGTLRLSQQRDRVQLQKTRGRLEIAANAAVRADEQLLLAGTLAGLGRYEGDVEVSGQVRPGPDTAGTLTIAGTLQLTSTATTRLRIVDATSHGSIAVSGQAFVAGMLRVDALAGYQPPVGAQLDVLAGGPGTMLAGRFSKAQLPTSVAGNYLHLSYNGPRVQLSARSSTPGFDLRDPPAAAVLAAWVAASPYDFVGFYLDSPCHGPSWHGQRAALVNLGLGVVAIYVGQQTAGASPCGANDTTAARGLIDANDAIARAQGEGFPAGTWLYLDVEHHPQHPVAPQMLAYVRAWVDRLLADGTYEPGIYLHQSDFAAIDTSVTSAFQAAGRADRARYWVVGGPQNTAITDSPARSGVPEATVWQQRLDFDETFAGHRLRIDRNVSVLADPSAP